MGLDVTAYSRLTMVGCPGTQPLEMGRQTVLLDVTVPWCDKPKHIKIYPADPYYSPRLAPFIPGCYETQPHSESFSFYAGSYGGYGAWRRELSLAILGVTPDVVWEKPDAFQGSPFVELISYSDCEGTIGTAACQKLARDFALSMPAIVNRWALNGSGDLMMNYCRWSHAFWVASDGGAVCFG